MGRLRRSYRKNASSSATRLGLSSVYARCTSAPGAKYMYDPIVRTPRYGFAPFVPRRLKLDKDFGSAIARPTRPQSSHPLLDEDHFAQSETTLLVQLACTQQFAKLRHKHRREHRKYEDGHQDE